MKFQSQTLAVATGLVHSLLLSWVATVCHLSVLIVAILVSLPQLVVGQDPPHRFWRAYATAGGSGSGHYRYLSVLDADGVVIPVSSTYLSASGVSGFNAANAVDGSTGTIAFWNPAATGWISVDFGAGNEQAVREWQFYVDGTVPGIWDIQHSDDGISWTTVFSGLDATTGVGLKVATWAASSTATPTATATGTPTATSTPLPAGSCPATVDVGCTTGFAKGLLLVKDSVAGKEKLVAKLIKGPSLTQADMGDPIGGDTVFSLCLYNDALDLVGEMIVDRAGDTCAGKPCWKAVGKDPPDGAGYNYKDQAGDADGVQKLLYKGGSAGKSKALVKGKGPNLPPDLTAGLEGSAFATMQLRASDGQCLSVTTTEVKKNEAGFFKAKGAVAGPPPGLTQTPTSTATGTASPSPTATPTPYEITMFSAGMRNGNMGSRSSSNTICEQAMASALPPGHPCSTAISFLSYTSEAVKDFPAVFGFPATVPIVGPTGTVIASNWTDFITGASGTPDNLLSSFANAGVTAGSHPNLWCGSDAAGRDSLNDCAEWTSSSSGVVGQTGDTTSVGPLSGHTVGAHIDNLQSPGCNNERQLLCVCY